MEASPLSILYVDDEAIARKYFVRAVGLDLHVQTAATLDEAIACLRTKNHDIGVLVTDYRMPNGSGADLLRWLAQEPLPLIVPIIFTAYANKAVLLDAVNAGQVFRVLEKPLNVEEMRLTLEAACIEAEARLSKHLLTIEQNKLAEGLASAVNQLTYPLAEIANSALGIRYRVANEPASLYQQAAIGKAASTIHENVRYCHSALSNFVAARGAFGDTAGLLLSGLINNYPLTAEQRAVITLNVKEDFPLGSVSKRVSLVLSFLLSNAVQALREQADGLIQVTVASRPNPCISIVDNSPGSEVAVPAALLSRPTMVDTESLSMTEGGLVFCSRIMQSVGGSINLYAQPGHNQATLNFPLS